MMIFLSSKSPSIPSSPAILTTIDFSIKFDLIEKSIVVRIAGLLGIVFSFFDAYLSISASLEMISRITLTEFLFDFFITFLIHVRIYVRICNR